MDNAEKKSSLSIVEKIIVFSMLVFIVTITTASFARRFQNMAKPFEEITVRVVGEVVHPATFNVSAEATLGDILAKVTLTDNAATELLAYDAKVVHDQIIIIPRKECVSVYVKGAVCQEGVYTFSEKATFQTLLARVSFDARADMKALKRKKRALHEGETVCVKFQK